MPRKIPSSRFTSLPRRRRGLGAVELLVCLSISSILLTSVAITYNASFNSYKDAQERGQLLNQGRSALYQIMRDIRMSDAAGPYDPSASITTQENTQFTALTVPGYPTSGPPGSGGSGVIGIQLAKTHPDSVDPTASPATPVIITYWFDQANTQILMTRQTGATTPAPTQICNFAQGLQIYMQPVTIPVNAQTNTPACIAMQRAVVTLTLANKKADGSRILTDANQNPTQIFTDSAMPRRYFGGI